MSECSGRDLNLSEKLNRLFGIGLAVAGKNRGRRLVDCHYVLNASGPEVLLCTLT